MLDRIVKNLDRSSDPNIIIGADSFDDAGVYQLPGGPALVQTLDFFTPIVDDPYDFGRISAANSLSDIYAMGAKPVTAMNIVAFPDTALPESVLTAILQGASDICAAARVAVLGGHSISDREIKFGLSVTGIADPEKLMRKDRGNSGDILVLTKPLGSGLLSNALMNNAAVKKDIDYAIEVMAGLNRAASEAAVNAGCLCATDISGFGLVGHLKEMILASGLSAEIDTHALPVLPGAMEIASGASFFSGGERRNLVFAGDLLKYKEDLPAGMLRIASDPQTSGGLLLAIPPAGLGIFETELREAGGGSWVIGSLIAAAPRRIMLK
ncbi:MAG: selenide, water dikinase SelD [Candidatus Krumholzibacteriota bacterium]|nr:selenide, water dikinase SelD [Candidatus Krumholzibacteriota bacterium]